MRTCVKVRDVHYIHFIYCTCMCEREKYVWIRIKVLVVMDKDPFQIHKQPIFHHHIHSCWAIKAEKDVDNDDTFPFSNNHKQRDHSCARTGRLPLFSYTSQQPSTGSDGNHVSFCTIGHVMDCWNSVGQRQTHNELILFGKFKFGFLSYSFTCWSWVSTEWKYRMSQFSWMNCEWIGSSGWARCVCVFCERGMQGTPYMHTLLGYVNLSIHTCSFLWNNVTHTHTKKHNRTATMKAPVVG